MAHKLLDAKVEWGDFYLTLQGVEDFDQYVFQKLESGELNSIQATNMWHYTDGYKLTLESTIKNGLTESVHCLKKTWSVIRAADYDSGSICFQTKYGSINALGFYGNVDKTATILNTADNKWYAEVVGYTDATAATDLVAKA